MFKHFMYLSLTSLYLSLNTFMVYIHNSNPHNYSYFAGIIWKGSLVGLFPAPLNRLMDDFGDTTISQALSAITTSYGAPPSGSSPTGVGVGAPSYYDYGPPASSFQVPTIDYRVQGVTSPSYIPLNTIQRWELVKSSQYWHHLPGWERHWGIIGRR